MRMLRILVQANYKSEAGSVLWISLDLGLPRFMLGLVVFPLGSIHLFSQALQAVASMAQIPVPFDMVPVLTFVQSLHTAGISLHLLSSIALFLTVHSSISRVSWVACLGSPSPGGESWCGPVFFVSLEEQGKGWEYLWLPLNSGFSWGYAYILLIYTASISLQLLLFKASS